MYNFDGIEIYSKDYDVSDSKQEEPENTSVWLDDYGWI